MWRYQVFARKVTWYFVDVYIIKRNNGFLFENMSFYYTHSIKTKIFSMLGNFWKSQKSIPSKKNPPVLIAKISSCKTHEIANLQKWTPTKILCHTVGLIPSWTNSCTVTVTKKVNVVLVSHLQNNSLLDLLEFYM